jgi:hypothetical protein
MGTYYLKIYHHHHYTTAATISYYYTSREIGGERERESKRGKETRTKTCTEPNIQRVYCTHMYCMGKNITYNNINCDPPSVRIGRRMNVRVFLLVPLCFLSIILFIYRKQNTALLYIFLSTSLYTYFLYLLYVKLASLPQTARAF